MKIRVAGFTGALVCLGGRPTASYTTTTPPASHGGFPLFPKNEPKAMDRNQRETVENSLQRFLPMNDSTVPHQRTKKSVRGWHQRVWSKVLRRRGQGVNLNMQAVAIGEQIADCIAHGLLPANLNLPSPEALFSHTSSMPVVVENLTLKHAEVVTSQKQVLERPPISSGLATIETETARVEKGSPFVRITRNTLEKMLIERLDRWSNGTNINTNVQCDPTSNLMQFLRGEFHCDATVNLDRGDFGSIRVSGGRLEVKDFSLNLFSFSPIAIPTVAPSPRYPNKFDFLARNLTFTQEDLWESPSIRNGLRRILTRILKNRGFTALTVTIQSIKILRSGKVSCRGQAATSLFGPPVRFEVRSGIGFASRGHILTFPGLEISLNPSLGLFVPIIPDVTVDLGHNAQLLDVTIDGDAGELKVSARVTITPEHTIQLKNYIQSSKSYGALCSIDVGRWLTRLGHFAH